MKQLWSDWYVVCRASIVKLDPDAGLTNPHCSAMGPNTSPSALPRLTPAHQSFLVPDGHIGPGLIGAVHLPTPFSHTPGHMEGVLHHMDHVHGQSGPLSQNPESMGGFKMAEGGNGVGSRGGYPGVHGFGFDPYACTQAPSKLQASLAWDNQANMQHRGQTAGAPPYGSSQGGPQALDDLEVANLNAFLESMDSEARADLMNGQHFQQHFPQQQQQHMQWPAAAKFEPCD